ncbi:hypothetical protein LQH03_20025, partial [Acinetobacter baumannii]|nr:hypothetical protein [Acinetobacter baumannii]
MDAIGVADRNTLAGVVRVHSNAKTAGLRPLIGCRLVVQVGEAPNESDHNVFQLVRPDGSETQAKEVAPKPSGSA